MQLTTTVSQKGQVVIPKKIRDEINLGISDLLKVDIRNGNIVLSPIFKTSHVFGMFKTKKPITKAQIKKTYKKATKRKFSRAQ